MHRFFLLPLATILNVACSSSAMFESSSSKTSNDDGKTSSIVSEQSSDAQQDNIEEDENVDTLSADRPQEITGAYLTVTCGPHQEDQTPRRTDNQESDDIEVIGCRSDEAEYSLSDYDVKAYLGLVRRH